MRTAYLDLVDYLAIAAEVTGLDVATLSRVTQLNLADSALHAPAAGWGDEELYPDSVDKAAVPVARLAKNHPMPDDNKRAAWVSLRACRPVGSRLGRSGAAAGQHFGTGSANSRVGQAPEAAPPLTCPYVVRSAGVEPTTF